jgi:hypothetical protein
MAATELHFVELTLCSIYAADLWNNSHFMADPSSEVGKTARLECGANVYPFARLRECVPVPERNAVLLRFTWGRDDILGTELNLQWDGMEEAARGTTPESEKTPDEGADDSPKKEPRRTPSRWEMMGKDDEDDEDELPEEIYDELMFDFDDRPSWED